jgi:DNA helicase-2/ATP-dependent DNA helicase PcrA
VNPADRAALVRIVDRPPRGLARLAAALLEEPASAVELPARAAEFGSAAQASAATLLATIDDLHVAAERGTGPAAMLDRALERTGYRAWLERHPDGPARLRTVARLRQLAARAELPLVEWLDAVALGDDPTPLDQEAVCLSSIHRSKGREWRATFAVGLEEGLIPHRRAAAEALVPDIDGDALDEELRVCYVALTRARERLFLSACQARTQGERIERRQPSRWLHALPPELLVTTG